MFYVPLKDAKTWGAGEPGSPILVNTHYNGVPEPVTEALTFRLLCCFVGIAVAPLEFSVS